MKYISLTDIILREKFQKVLVNMKRDGFCWAGCSQGGCERALPVWAQNTIARAKRQKFVADIAVESEALLIMRECMQANATKVHPPRESQQQSDESECCAPPPLGAPTDKIFLLFAVARDPVTSTGV